MDADEYICFFFKICVFYVFFGLVFFQFTFLGSTGSMIGLVLITLCQTC
jgi:hypothetical protein